MVTLKPCGDLLVVNVPRVKPSDCQHSGNRLDSGQKQHLHQMRVLAANKGEMALVRLGLGKYFRFNFLLKVFKSI